MFLIEKVDEKAEEVVINLPRDLINVSEPKKKRK